MKLSNTIKTVAEKCNVSAATVSRVVNNKPYVNEKTRKKVLAALNELGYVPNQVARSLKAKTTNTIGIIVPDVCEVFFGQIIKGIDSIVCPGGYSVILADTNENPENEDNYLGLLFEKRVDALVLATVNRSGEGLRPFLQHNIPVVLIDNLPKEEVEADCVVIDNVQASRMAVSHLLEKGHTRIAIIAGSMEETTGADRLFGYRQSLLDTGIPADEALIRIGDYKERSGYAAMASLIKNKENAPFSAVYVTSEMMTFGAIKAIRESGLRIPEDIALVAFDIHDKTGLIKPGITTLRQPEQEIGQYVGELILQRLEELDEEKPKRTKKKILLPAYLEAKESSGPDLA